jgi:hypothetical protein
LKTGRSLFAARDKSIIQLFTGASVITKAFTTKALYFGYPVHDKQAIDAGVQLSNISASSAILTAALSVNGDISGLPFPVTVDVAPTDYPGVFKSDSSFGQSQVDGRGRRLQVQYTEASDAMYVIAGIPLECQLGATWPEVAQDPAVASPKTLDDVMKT